jgi:hypothetical protein
MPGKRTLMAAVAFWLALSACIAAEPETLNIGSKRQLFVDEPLIDKMSGQAELRLNHPERKEIVLEFDKPWEGNGCGYQTVFQDGNIYRMYYKAWQISSQGGVSNPVVICYAQSADGIHWTRPDLGLVAFQGSTKNNIILDKIGTGGCHDFSPFIDTNPKTALQEKYKAIGYVLGMKGDPGLYGFVSADAIHWRPIQNDFIIKDQGWVFDTQNIAFWSDVEQQYVMYYRKAVNEVRHIARAVSADFIHWTREGVIDFEGNDPDKSEQFYTNQIKPYYRAPELYIGFPARYCDRGWINATDALPSPELRRERAKGSARYGSAVTDALLISSRDGKHFKRWDDAFIRPGLRTQHNWAYGDNYIAWHVVETAPANDDQPTELSLYATESYFTGTSNRLRRYTLRLDGFASLYAPHGGGEILTKPFIFSGRKLLINFSTSAAGNMFIEMQDAAGHPLPGFELAECHEIFGDNVEYPVAWKTNASLESLQGRAVRLRIVLREADVFSFQFSQVR